jgi:hypothetical protein
VVDERELATAITPIIINNMIDLSDFLLASAPQVGQPVFSQITSIPRELAIGETGPLVRAA